MAADLLTVRARLATAEATVARLERAVQRDELASAFPLGPGCGNAASRKRAAAGLDRTISAAVALPAARARVATLRARIATLSAPVAPTPVKAPRARRELDDATYERLVTIRRFYLHGASDEAPPFDDISDAEWMQARTLKLRAVA